MDFRPLVVDVCCVDSCRVTGQYMNRLLLRLGVNNDGYFCVGQSVRLPKILLEMWFQQEIPVSKYDLLARIYLPSQGNTSRCDLLIMRYMLPLHLPRSTFSVNNSILAPM